MALALVLHLFCGETDSRSQHLAKNLESTPCCLLYHNKLSDLSAESLETAHRVARLCEEIMTEKPTQWFADPGAKCVLSERC